VSAEQITPIPKKIQGESWGSGIRFPSRRFSNRLPPLPDSNDD